jgi:tetratricopeptide (TPR) repeat protein
MLRVNAVIFLFGSLACAQTDPNQACLRASELHRAGKIPDAIPEYQACVKSHPNVAELRSDFGAALARLGRYEEAIEQYQEALHIAPGNPAVRRNLGLAFYKSGAMAKAAEVLSSLHQEEPGDLQVILLLADSYLQMGELQQVIDLLAPIAPQREQDRAFSYLLGTALIRKGRVSEGQALVDGILRDADSAEARFLLGTAAFMKQDYPHAVEEFSKAIQLNPALPSLYSYYGQALLLTGDADGADAAFRKELGSNPADFESNLMLGEILAQRGRVTEALVLLKQAMQARPDSLEARYELGAAYLAAGQPEKARPELETLIARAPDSGPAHAELAKAYERLHLDRDAQRERAIAAKLSARTKPSAPDEDLLAAGAMAPDFTLRQRGSSEQIHLASVVGERPLILIFGSYTCPKFRFEARALNAMYQRYHIQAAFLMIYVQEAHTEEGWQSSVNQRENIALPPAKTIEQKEGNAGTCSRKLDLKFPIVIDGLDRKVEMAYAGWPSAVYVVDKNGRIAWRSRLGEVELSTAEMDKAIQAAVAGAR